MNLQETPQTASSCLTTKIWQSLKNTFHYSGRACRSEFFGLTLSIHGITLIFLHAALTMTLISENMQQEYFIDELTKISTESAKKHLNQRFTINENNTPDINLKQKILSHSSQITFKIAISIYLLASFPIISSAIRRLHDSNRSGWLILIPLANIALLFASGDKGENRFGPNPRLLKSHTPPQPSENTKNLASRQIKNIRDL